MKSVFTLENDALSKMLKYLAAETLSLKTETASEQEYGLWNMLFSVSGELKILIYSAES